ncbi:hypothetical protein FUA23_22025 [Neolewinella aurantiaca]|uniref:HTH psq-type domain-containing protein n=1 Tax=Neolewinella aurantiaca TaxID=2602767 RepID=A0A5C7FBB3_9BACT|nr:hypothetical protein [Neolewinella aurantiaca]TXF81309.1 hypothetical protein FUA23_22025 [Neolewinella aurantiaca]
MYLKSRANIAEEFGVCRKTLRKWMDAMPYEFPYLLAAPWQKLIYSELGYPPGVTADDFAKIKAPKEYRGEQ